LSSPPPSPSPPPPPSPPQLVAGLLFITALAGLALTLGEAHGPSEGARSHAAVFYVNPVLFACSWVHKTNTEAH